ncbi:DUF192 domain-containing protein [Bacteriovorax sp. DB6_IX]|uniref:DUF192 domain-containing protein n=1 Tax=Bacteriovorax sp. DB6_IX TaxID=1353530 RepID=UPI0006A745A1|nr:DUF192 domain-containing protein [Bacteriovorax sp. DB6_IX]
MKVKLGEQFISQQTRLANNPISRMIGLMFKKEMKNYDGLLIRPCNSIHTFFMRFSIDAVFLNKDFKVIRIYRDLKPWRMTTIIWKANQVLELRAGTLPDNVKEGDSLTVCTN